MADAAAMVAVRHRAAPHIEHHQRRAGELEPDAAALLRLSDQAALGGVGGQEAVVPDRHLHGHAVPDERTHRRLDRHPSGLLCQAEELDTFQGRHRTS
jgi:hypothetical protein